MRAQTSFLSLLGMALRLTVRRGWLYGAAVVAAIAAQGLVAALWHSPHSIEIAGDVFPPILTALVYAFVAADTSPQAPAAAAIWERVLERSWAVIAIDFASGYLIAGGIGALLSDDVAVQIGGVFALFLCALLVFADTSATLDDGAPFWLLLPAAVWRSIQLALRPHVYARALTILALELLVFAISYTLAAVLTQAHAAGAVFWGSVPLATATVPPIAALTVLVYRDAAAGESAKNDF